MAEKEHIEREAAIRIVCEDCNRVFPDEPCEPADCELMQALRSIPAADVRPVKRGKWIQTTQPMGWRDEECAECSVCGEDFVLDEWAMDDFTNLMNFCPACGAKMDGGGDDAAD